MTSAIAKYFGLDVYFVSLGDPSIKDPDLSNLFMNLPPRSIVLLEDIDVAGVGNTRSDEDDKGGVTLSGILNAIDGPLAAEGRVLIMSTNNPDGLDSALVRPGRTDMKVEFPRARKDDGRQMFIQFYEEAGPDVADAFAGKVPEDTFSAAEIQEYLIGMKKKTPDAAVESFEPWICKMLKERDWKAETSPAVKHV